MRRQARPPRSGRALPPCLCLRPALPGVAPLPTPPNLCRGCLTATRARRATVLRGNADDTPLLRPARNSPESPPNTAGRRSSRSGHEAALPQQAALSPTLSRSPRRFALKATCPKRLSAAARRSMLKYSRALNVRNTPEHFRKNVSTPRRTVAPLEKRSSFRHL